MSLLCLRYNDIAAAREYYSEAVDAAKKAYSKDRRLYTYINLILTGIKMTIAFAARDYDACLKYYDDPYHTSDFRRNKVIDAYHLGIIFADRGQQEQAREYFGFAAEHSGTMAIRQKAQDYLAGGKLPQG